MSISGISSSTNPYQDPMSQVRSVRKDFSGLTTSLASGDLSAAQTAFTTLMHDLGNSGVQRGQQTGATSKLSTDLTAVGTALNSGDVTGAKAAFATLMQDIGNNGAQSATATSSTNTQSAANGQSNVTASLLDALQTTSGTSQNGSASSVNTLFQALRRYAQVGFNLNLPAAGLVSAIGRYV